MNNQNRIQRRQRAAKRNTNEHTTGGYTTEHGIERAPPLHPTKGYRDRNVDRGLGTRQRANGILRYLASKFGS